MEKRVFNFSAGPSMLPLEVLEKAANEMTNCDGTGMGVMEMSHRSKDYEKIIGGAESLLRELMNIPDNYKVLFLQGGASSQFAMIPLNLMKRTGKADYVITGVWAKKAAAEAEKYGTVVKVASSADKTFSYIPKLTSDMFSKDASYIHVTTNNTIYGTHFNTELPDTGDIPVVADMSSSILSEEVDVSKYGVIYAGAQKNMGPAGLTVVIIREDLIGNAMDITPTMFDYSTHSENDSMFNTPPTYSIYIMKLVLEWIKSNGGIKAIHEINVKKAKLLYDFLDNSEMFSATVAEEDRSLMNIPFVTDSEELNAEFLKVASANGLVNLKGHRSVGGMRASIYNAMPIEGVEALVNLMKEFEEAHK